MILIEKEKMVEEKSLVYISTFINESRYINKFLRILKN